MSTAEVAERELDAVSIEDLAADCFAGSDGLGPAGVVIGFDSRLSTATVEA